MGGEILHAHAELERNIELLRNRGGERGLQIAAMDDPVRRAIALRRLAERDAHDFASAPPDEHAQGCRRDHMRPQPLADAEIDQDARGVGRELDAGAGFRKPLGLFQHDDAEAIARKCKRRRKPANAGACDYDAARGRHGKELDVSGLDLSFIQRTFRRPRLIGRKRRIVAIERRAIRANVFGIVAHVAIDMRMVEWRLGADAHKFLGADLDDRDAGIVVEMRNYRVRHARDIRLSKSAGTIAV